MLWPSDESSNLFRCCVITRGNNRRLLHPAKGEPHFVTHRTTGVLRQASSITRVPRATRLCRRAMYAALRSSYVIVLCNHPIPLLLPCVIVAARPRLYKREHGGPSVPNTVANSSKFWRAPSQGASIGSAHAPRGSASVGGEGLGRPSSSSSPPYVPAFGGSVGDTGVSQGSGGHHHHHGRRRSASAFASSTHATPAVPVYGGGGGGGDDRPAPVRPPAVSAAEGLEGSAAAGGATAPRSPSRSSPPPPPPPDGRATSAGTGAAMASEDETE